MSKLLEELNRRNVIRVGTAYFVGSWVLLQIIDVVGEILELPGWLGKTILAALAIGLIPTLLFAWAFELTPDGIKRQDEVDRNESITQSTGKKLNILIIAALVVAVIFLVVDRQRITSEVGPEAVVAADPSVAVLPFVNRSSDEDFFADGITEEILNVLASVDGLRVAGRTSSFAFKDKNENLQVIADTLGVEHVLEGSVRRDGDTVRITAQLIKASDGFNLWSQTYDRKMDSVFEVQDEISREILSQLTASLLDEGAVDMMSKQRTDPATYELYLRAKQRIYSRRRDAIDLAIEELDEAIKTDPEYAPAYAQRGIATAMLSNTQYGDMNHEESTRIAQRFIDEALQRDPQLSDALAGNGLLLLRDLSRIDEGIDALEAALEVNPNNIDALNWLNSALQLKGNFKDSLNVVRDIARRDPLYRPAFTNGLVLMAAFGLEEEANEWIRRQSAFDPDSPEISQASAFRDLLSGNAGKAVAAMRDSELTTGVQRNTFLSSMFQVGMFEEVAATEGLIQSFALAQLDRRDEAYEVAQEQSRNGFHGPYVSLLFGDRRYQDLVDFVDERWPSLAAYANENPGNFFGIGDLAPLAISYQQLDDQENYLVVRDIMNERYANLRAQELDNFGLTLSEAMFHALDGELDLMVDRLDDAVDEGLASVYLLDVLSPMIDPLRDDPRVVAIEIKMKRRLNENREFAGLPPLYPGVDIES
ncbi:MAG: hypothetical protein AAGF72_13760 [Pseudomonadota bacterium]